MSSSATNSNNSILLNNPSPSLGEGNALINIQQQQQQQQLLDKDSNTGGNNPSSSGNSNNSMGSFKLVLLVLMVLQNSSTVLVGRYTRAGVPKDDLYDVNHLILVIELGKLVLSCALEFYSTAGKLIASLNQHVLQRPTDALKILVPALLYLVQNTLLYVALSNLTAPLFQVTYQAKLVTTAIVSVMMLNRTYSFQQWVCLVMLSLGVAIVVLGEQSSSSSSTKTGGSRALAESTTASAMATQNLALGLTAVSIACFSSALAGVYFEKVLKKTNTNNDATKFPPASLWMRNIQLSFFSIIIAAVQGFLKEGGLASSDNNVNKPYLHGFTFWTWVLVLLQAGGGLLVAAVIKYADNVLKGLATGVSVVFATGLSILLFGTPLSMQFTFGATMILASVYFFSNPLPPSMQGAVARFGNNNNKKTEDTVQMNPLLPK